jgi:hypothetical protein
MTLRAVCCLLCVLVLGLIGSAQGPSGPALPDASLYTCRWASTPPKIDGLADEPCWEHAVTISNFRASWLASDSKTAPIASGDSIPTQAKMVWDKEYLYVWAKLTDNDIQGTIKERDEQTWLDDCFELFLKPSKDRPGYYEFHVTPANTQMDLYIPERVPKAYAIYKSADTFDFQSSVQIDGTLEDRTDADRSWQVEFKIAWKDFHRTGGGPGPGDSWTYSLCRYDYDRSTSEPRLTSTSALTQPSFHRHEEFSSIRFLGPPSSVCQLGKQATDPIDASCHVPAGIGNSAMQLSHLNP